MPILQPAIQIQRMAPATRNLVRGFPARILAAALSTALMPAETGHHLSRLAADAEYGAEVTDGSGVKVVVRPVVTLLDQDRGFGSIAIGLGLTHHFGSLMDLGDVDAGNFGGNLWFGLFLGQQPFLPVFFRAFETLDLELAPGGAPLPRGVTRALAEAGVRLPLVGDVVADEILIVPAIFYNDPRNRHMHHGIRTGIHVEVQATVLLYVSGASSLARINHDDPGIVAADTFQNPGVPDNGLGLEWIRAGDQQAIGLGKILVGGAKDIVADIDPARDRVDKGGVIMMRHRWGIDRLKRQLGQRIGVFEILVTVVFHRPGALTVFADDVIADFRGDVERKIPAHRGQLTVDPYHRFLQTIFG